MRNRKNTIITFLLIIGVIFASFMLFGCEPNDTSSVGGGASVDESAEISHEESTEASQEISEDISVEVSDEVSIDESIDEMAEVKTPVLSVTLHDQDDRVHKSYYVGATIQLKDPSRRFDTVYDAKGEIKIRGNSTSSGAKKPYNIKFSEAENLLGLGESKKWYLLANFYDKTLMRNKLAYDLAQILGLSNTSRCTYVDLYLNGVFLGNYLLCESIGIGEDRVDLNIDNNDFLFEYEPWIGYSNPAAYHTPLCGVLLGYNDREDATRQQKEYLKEFFTKAERALLDGDWDNIQRYFDVDSFVNHYLLNEFFKNVDIGTSSTRYYLKDGKLYAGPVWDLDLSSGNADKDYYGAIYSTSNLHAKNGQWYKWFTKDEEFMKLVKARFVEMNDYFVNIYAENELGNSRIDVLIAQHGESFERNFSTAGWDVSEKVSELERIPDSTYEENVEYLREWFEGRHKWLFEKWEIEIEN
ncbi:MAG: CotH kinase family protein [Clostridia bacterium]|nr:CotH kinase family protein [Clostridia bacterium]